MASHYLIDYENVRETGVSYCHRAKEEDTVYLIYTSNASKIGLDALAGMKAAVKVVKVAAGKQSLDMHLISILGYLLHKHGREDRYVVISKDTGYDGVLRYWSAEGYKTERITGAKETAEKKEGAAAVQTAAEETDAGARTDARSSHSRRQRRSRSAANQRPTAQGTASEEIKADTQIRENKAEEQGGISKPDDEVSAGGEVKPDATVNADTAAKRDETVNAESTSKPDDAANADSKGKPDTAEKPADTSASEAVKDAVKMPDPDAQTPTGSDIKAAAQPSSGEVRKRLNGRLLSILSKEKVDIKTAGQIASLAVKNVEAKNSKQLIYRSLLQKFGQKDGLAYYGLIKSEL